MWSLIVVLGLVAVVVLVGVLVALGMRASRAGGDDDWMAEDEQQPRGRRGGRSRGRRGEDEFPEEEPYGDMRVAGAPIGDPHQQLPAAPHVGPAPLPAAPPAAPPPGPPGRSSDEMDDDEYWSTITFDKPRFPWRQNAEQQADERGHDPLGPAAGQNAPPVPQMGAGEQFSLGPIEQHPPGYVEQNPVGPFDTPAPPTTPQPAVPANPLDLPVSRPSETEPGAMPAYGSAEQSGSYPSYGQEQQGGYGQEQQGGYGQEQQGGYGQEQQGGFGGDPHGYGDDPLNTGERPSYGTLPPATPPPPLPAPSAPAPAPAPMSASANDDNRLPSVDELLAKIQSDRKRASAESEPPPPAPSQPTFDVNDPLNTGDRPSYRSSSSYGSPSPSTPSSGSGWSSDNYGSDPLSSGNYPTSGGSSGGGYGGSSSSSSYDTGGYGSTPNYSQQDDPLGTNYSGSYGNNDSSSGGGYSGGNYGGQGSGGYDSGYYNSPQQGQGQGQGQGYDPNSGQQRPEDNATQAYPTSPYGNSYGSENRDDKDKRPEDWNSYGDYRH